MDGNLLIDLKNGDEKAFETLFWEYNQHVYHFVYSLLYDKSLWRCSATGWLPARIIMVISIRIHFRLSII